jgi:hypothetical protein
MAYSLFDPGCCCELCDKCTCCGESPPRQIQIVAAGFVPAAAPCDDADNLNGTWILEACCHGRDESDDPTPVPPGGKPDSWCCAQTGPHDDRCHWWTLIPDGYCGEVPARLEFSRGAGVITVRVRRDGCGDSLLIVSKADAAWTCPGPCDWEDEVITAGGATFTVTAIP